MTTPFPNLIFPSGDTTGATDLAAINAALSEYSVALLTPGQYYTNGAIEPPASACILAGSGPGATVINCLSSSAHGIYTSGLSNIAIRGLNLTGPGDSATSYDGIHLDTPSAAISNIDLENLIITRFGRNGVYLNTPIVSSITNVIVSYCAENGFDLLDGTSLTLTASYANNVSNFGFLLNGMSYSKLNGCASDFGVWGYYLEGCRGIDAAGCGAEDQTDGGWQITESCAAITLASCVNRGNPGVACLVTGDSADVTLIGFTEESPGSGATASIEVDAGSSAVVISPNVITATDYATGTTTTVLPGLAWNYVGAAGQPGFDPGWSNRGSGWAQLAFRLTDDRTVWIKGWVANSNVTNVRLFTLPSGYMPASQQTIVGYGYGRAIQWNVGTSGVVGYASAAMPATGNYYIDGFVSLDL